MQIKRAIILCAGKGTRLGDLAAITPKPLLSVNNTIILENTLNQLMSYGIERVDINMHHGERKIKEFITSLPENNIKFTLHHEDELLGTAGALNNMTFSDNELFFVIYGDNFYTSNSFSALEDKHKSSNAYFTMLLHKREDVSESGVVIVDDNMFVESFIEKPGIANYADNLVNAGIYLCAADIKSFLTGEVQDFAHDVIPKILSEGLTIQGVLASGDVIPVDTPFLYNKANGLNV